MDTPTKVTNLELPIDAEEKILRLDVPVDDVLQVKVEEGISHLAN